MDTALPPPSSGRLPISSVDRFEVDGIAAIETALVTLSPDFVDALKGIAPKKRPSWARVPMVFVLGIVAVVAALGLDRSTREFVLQHRVAAPVVATTQTQPAVSVSSQAKASVAAVPTVVRPTVLVDDPTPPPSVESSRKATTKKPASKPVRKFEGRPGAWTQKLCAGFFNA